jgi:hypothetical protein
VQEGPSGLGRKAGYATQRAVVEQMSPNTELFQQKGEAIQVHENILIWMKR